MIITFLAFFSSMGQWLLDQSNLTMILSVLTLFLTFLVWRVSRHMLKVAKDSLEVSRRSLDFFAEPLVTIEGKRWNEQEHKKQEEDVISGQYNTSGRQYKVDADCTLHNDSPIPIYVRKSDFHVVMISSASSHEFQAYAPSSAFSRTYGHDWPAPVPPPLGFVIEVAGGVPANTEPHSPANPELTLVVDVTVTYHWRDQERETLPKRLIFKVRPSTFNS